MSTKYSCHNCGKYGMLEVDFDYIICSNCSEKNYAPKEEFNPKLRKIGFIGGIIGLILFVGSYVFDFLKSEESTKMGHNKLQKQFVIGKEYVFSCGENDILFCNECASCWGIIFKDGNNAELWSYPCLGERFHKMCSSDVSYKFDQEKNEVTILSVHNSYVSSVCLKRFIGVWKWNGEGFSSMHYPECNFD